MVYATFKAGNEVPNYLEKIGTDFILELILPSLKTSSLHSLSLVSAFIYAISFLFAQKAPLHISASWKTFQA